MNVYQHCPPELGYGIKRVVTAIAKYAPADITFVEQANDADLVIYHIVGVQNFTDTTIDQVIAAVGKPYAMVQYCYRTTERPTTAFWHPLWRKAQLVWSYYDLDRISFDEGAGSFPRFYYAPLGVESDVFKPSSPVKLFTIGTSGFVAETEGVSEAYAAVRRTNGTMLHLGPDLRLGGRVASIVNIPDEVVARLWSECRYVAGLRRVEGFELPAVEGLFCGSRPVCFDAPHYRQWFGDLADYIPEGGPAEVANALTTLFKASYRAVTWEETLTARHIFHWPTLVGNFWERLR